MVFGSNAPMEANLNAIAMEPFLRGRQPFSRAAEVTEVPADAPLLPPGVTPALVHEEDGRRSHLVTGPGWTMVALRRRASAAVIRVCAETEQLAEDVLARTVATLARSTDPSDSQVPIGFWHTEACTPGGVRAPRTVDLPSWQDIRGNYPQAATSELDELMAVRPEAVSGRLVLLHGPAGTGKTTAIRALAYEWRDWCQVDTVLDPESLLDDPGYLTSVILGEQRSDDRRWRLLVLEDCDELVRLDAKEGSGQALSRLLNLTDGLLGQGLDILVCLTTNESVTGLHPAVVRAGRCLAEVEIGPLPRNEARAWLGANGADSAAGAADNADRVGADGATLAELYELRREPRA